MNLHQGIWSTAKRENEKGKARERNVKRKKRREDRRNGCVDNEWKEQEFSVKKWRKNNNRTKRNG